jgi:predicted O-methyltransferase YrrM
MRPGPDELKPQVQELWGKSAGSAEAVHPKTYDEAEEMYRKIKRLIAVQNLDHLVYLHKLDVTRELDRFFGEHPHIQFKIIFLDAGTYDVVHACLSCFWPRLTSGGVLILDQYNHEIAHGETRAVKEYLPDLPIHSYSFTALPSAFIIKPGRPVKE